MQPGVRNLAISEAARPYGLFYAPDPSSQLACTHRRQRRRERRRRALPEVRADGAQHPEARGRSPSTASALTLGVGGARRARLRPDGADDRLGGPAGGGHRDHRAPAAAARRRPGPAGRLSGRRAAPAQAVADIIAAGIIPAGLEMMDTPGADRPPSSSPTPAIPTDAGAILICECDGDAGDAEAELAQVADDLPRRRRRARCASPRTRPSARGSGPAARAPFPAMGRLAPDYYCIDGTIPRRQPARRCWPRSASCRATHGLRGGQRLPRRRRQPAPADPLRRRGRRRAGARRGAGRGDPGAVRGGRRHHHRRARRRAREDQPDVRAVHRRTSSTPSPPSRPPSTRPACSIPARRSPPSPAAPSSAPCTSTPAELPLCPTCRRF